ncbi:NAD-dependent DNA ligase LigA [Streptomyces nigrescens]|uniref:NAD-dependent DNA ligase LigA n=1 Tax=Streptomyces nigrescens TaxID=1920 RepID=UPI0036F73C3F
MTTAAPSVLLVDHAAYDAAVDTALAACAAYYGAGDTALDDASYDDLARQIAAYEVEHPEHRRLDSPLGKVGGGAAPAGDVAHTVPMLSLGNVFDAEDLTKWGASLARRLGGPVRGGFAVEVKFDGLAVAARYRKGRLVQLIMRGDHAHGEDVSHAIGSIVGLPTQLATPATIEVRGEVLLTRVQFETANETRRAHKAKPFSHPRAGAAGTLAAKNRKYPIAMSFFAYGAVELDGESFVQTVNTHQAVMAMLASAGVQTAADTPAGLRVYGTLEEVQQRVDEIKEMRPDLPFGIDGVVVKANDVAEQLAAGNGSDRPHWATAYKLPPVQRRTRLIGVEWNVGKTRIIAPRAVLEPVELEGSTVRYATLNNPRFIRDLGVRIGDTVVVSKAGDIIPRIESVVIDKRTGEETPVAFPTACPQCGGEVNTSGERWECAEGVSGSCGLLPALKYSVGRDQLDIEGLGSTYLESLIDSGAVTDVADLFTLTHEQLAKAAGSTRRADALMQQIAQAKAKPLNRVFCALGIVRTGRSLSKEIARHFGTMDAIRTADVEALAAVNKLAPAHAPKIAAHLAVMGPVIDKLVEAGVNMTEPSAPASASASGPLSGEVVVVTGGMVGALAGRKRNEMNDLIEDAGGSPSGSVSKKTTILVAGENAGSKLAKAQALGTKILTEQEFADLVADHLS